MDWLRSCYRTKMAVTSDGQQANVTWYFVPTRSPAYGRTRYASLNWSFPTRATGIPGEVIGASRTWVDGSTPPWVNANNPENSTLGLPDWYLNGAPPDWPFIMPITWYGARAYPGPFDVGTFPPPQSFFTASLTSNHHGRYTTQLPATPYYGWQLPDPVTNRPWAAWFTVPNTSPLWACQPTYTLVGRRGSVLGDYTVLRCTSLNGFISTWDDPKGTFLEAGEVLTLDATP